MEFPTLLENYGIDRNWEGSWKTQGVIEIRAKAILVSLTHLKSGQWTTENYHNFNDMFKLNQIKESSVGLCKSRPRFHLNLVDGLPSPGPNFKSGQWAIHRFGEYWIIGYHHLKFSNYGGAEMNINPNMRV